MSLQQIAISLLIAFALVILFAGILGIERAGKWAGYIQAAVTVGAIIVAVYLYYAERRGTPHADVSQTVQAVKAGPDVVAIEAYVVVKNLGSQLLTVSNIYSRVQMINADSLGVPDIVDRSGEALSNAVGTFDDGHRKAFTGPEARWRQLQFHNLPLKNEIEPGESDLITVSFVFRCPRARYVRVASDVTKPTSNSDQTGGNKGLVWKTRSMVDLKDVCGST